MKQGDWSRLILGVILVTFVACRPVMEEEVGETAENVALDSPVTAVAQQQPTATSKPNPTKSPPPKPSALPTVDTPAQWQTIGNATIGLQIAAPPEWIDLSEQTPTPTTTSMGLVTLLAANSDHTGSSLLAGKSITSGAYVGGLIANFTLNENSPLKNLEAILETLSPDVTPLAPGAFFTPPASAGDVTAAYVDVTGDVASFFADDSVPLQTRILFFQPNTPNNKQAVFLFAAPAAEWPSYAATFEQMAQTIVVYDINTSYAIGGGLANVMGSVMPGVAVNGRIDSGVRDVWSFQVDSDQYITVLATPSEPFLDLILTIVGPDGQIITRVDSGYAGNAEVAPDMLLGNSGTYYVEVAEFSGQPGPYTLQLTVNNTPLFSGGGQIQFGQGIQSTLPTNTQHIWTFAGTASHEISIVLTPDDTVDVILNLYGPDGTRLIALDEGFSGDAEVVSGFTLPLTGQYNLVVRSFAGNSGSYTLVLDEGSEQTENFYDAGDMVYGDVKQETFQPNEAHIWFFQGRAEDEVMIEVIPLQESLDLDIWLLDPNLERLAAVDEFLEGGSEVIHQTLPSDGQYLILVREFNGNPGEYQMALTAMPADVPVLAGSLAYGDSTSGTLTAEQTSLWSFAGNEGDKVTILLTPAHASEDFVLSLRDPSGATVLTVDVYTAGLAETIHEFVLSADGIWGIEVREFFGEVGEYTLTVTGP